MKRRAAVTAALLALVMLFAQCAYADGMVTTSAPVTSGAPVTGTAPANGDFVIVKTVPADGETGKQPANFAVKIVFSEDVSAEANDSINASLLKITDPEGKEQKFTLVHHQKYPNELWFILDEDLTPGTKYDVSVGSGVKASSGKTLAQGMNFSFETRNAKKDNAISVLLTLGMVVIMFTATAKSTKKQAADARAAVKGSGEKLTSDPYRLAKERGISLDEAKELIAKEKEKEAKRAAAAEKAKAKAQEEAAAKEAEILKRIQEIHDASVYKVKTKGSLKAHGKQLPKSLAKKLAAKKKKRR